MCLWGAFCVDCSCDDMSCVNCVHTVPYFMSPLYVFCVICFEEGQEAYAADADGDARTYGDAHEKAEDTHTHAPVMSLRQ
jgi:hypothetical protein